MFQAPCKVCFFGKEDTGVKAEGKDGKAGTNAPRFLGAFSTPPSSLTSPLIGQFTASHEDYFIYTGITTSNWTQNRIYQWDATQNRWNMLAVPTAANRGTATKYWEALPQLTAGTMEQVISIAFINSLIANEAFIKTLFSQYITILANGYIQSDGKDAQNNPLFIIKSTGEAIFRFIKTIGMEAVDAWFEGGITAGGLWDKNGNVINANALSGIMIPKTGIQGKLRNVKVEETLQITNSERMTQGQLSIDGVMVSYGLHSYIRTNNYIEGRMSLNELASRIQTMYPSVGIANTITIRGMIIIDMVTGGGPSGPHIENWPYLVSRVSYVTQGFSLRAMRISGTATPDDIIITGNSMNASVFITFC